MSASAVSREPKPLKSKGGWDIPAASQNVKHVRRIHRKYKCKLRAREVDLTLLRVAMQ